MSVQTQPEVWLRGPIEGIELLLQPVAHALLQMLEDVGKVCAPLTHDQLWQRPGGAASVRFHLQHLSGSIDRLFTYARGEILSDGQRAALLKEATDRSGTAEELIQQLQKTIEAALSQLRSTDSSLLLKPREVGRAKLPATVLGLLFHAAEHAQRHAGQIITTAKVVQNIHPPSARNATDGSGRLE
jgi:uncharacterized damage-inducible protein DinB